MAGQRLTDKTELAQNLGNTDLLMAVDISDTTGSAAGTSKKVQSKYIITTAQVTGNRDLNSNPLTLVATPGAGYFIQPLTVTAIWDYGTTDNTTTNYVYLGYDSSSTSVYWARQRDFYKNVSHDASYVMQGGIAPASGTWTATIANKPFLMWGNADLTGDSTFKVWTTYQVVKIV